MIHNSNIIVASGLNTDIYKKIKKEEENHQRVKRVLTALRFVSLFSGSTLITLQLQKLEFNPYSVAPTIF